MNPFVNLLGGRDALLARETLVTCIQIVLFSLVRLRITVLVDPASSSWGKTWARDDHVIPIHYSDWPCSQHGCSDSVVVITPNR